MTPTRAETLPLLAPILAVNGQTVQQSSLVSTTTKNSNIDFFQLSDFVVLRSLRLSLEKQLKMTSELLMQLLMQMLWPKDKRLSIQ
jgi:hypothetical protein